MTQSYALVTGASAGLGTEFARQLAARGLNLVLVARRGERLKALADSLTRDYDVTVKTLVADLAQPSAPLLIEQFCDKNTLQIDWLINNAGIAGPDLLEDRDWSEQQAFFQLMMLSVTELCHRFVPAMANRGFGRVVNVASVAGRIPRSGGCNYGPSKTYLIAVSEELNLTVAGQGVHVTALCPGFTHTDFHETAGLTDMKAGMPRWLWYGADTVVNDGIRGAEAGKSIVVSGRLYRWLDPLFQSVWTRRFFRIKARPEPS
ncbi:MAG: SDR family NAD(P)-dependent oxidoreductase [Luminiphilus sp.]|nr:SDR family NAD(P)-dependent oxidoreductase [Luminiphilus sp.]